MQCMYMYNMDKDELICKSCPVYGTEEGEPILSHICMCMIVRPADCPSMSRLRTPMLFCRFASV